MLEVQEAKKPFVRKLLRWGRANQRDFPWRHERDPFRVLVAEVLLQRSRGVTVAKVYEQLFGRWPDAAALAAADVEAIRDVIRPLGLTRRAEQLQKLASQVVGLGGVPRSAEDMLRFSGVGRYAASATASAVFQQRQPTVDGTSARVYRRYFGLHGDRDAQVDDEVWELVAAAMPSVGTREWNWAVLDLAAQICLPKVPRCPECPLQTDCFVGRSRTLVSETPKT
ncbi:MAG: A/G-specific adenine glycosylase [Actinomycetota bacterium]|nr:A/G-specific adenine glycosylase [Actinomycetota bacterium]